jgi:hypothetical protein
VTKGFGAGLIVLFFAVGGYTYYNVSYLNEWLTKDEQQDRAIIYEKALKKYQGLPLPSVTNMVESVDLYPEEKRTVVDARVTIENRTDKPISQMLLDADGLTDYSIAAGGQPVPFSNPLLYRRGKFSLFGPAADTSDFRLYTFRTPLAPGDSMVLEVHSLTLQKGFTNGLYAPKMLNNGTVASAGLPGLGYDDDDEVSSPYVRRKAGLPPKTEEEIAQNDPVGVNTLESGVGVNLRRMEVTVSVPGDQSAVCHGDLVGKWTTNGRNYFHYVADRPGMYPPFILVAGRYAERRDSVQLDHPVGIEVYYNPAQGANLDRYIEAYKDGLTYYSHAYGSYPYTSIRQAEISNYGPREAVTTTMNLYAEQNGWNAHFTDPDQYDYLHFEVTRALAQQWWRYQVAPNETVGSLVLSEGLAAYDAEVMNEKKYGVENMRRFLLDQTWPYTIFRQRLTEREHPVLTANFWFEWSSKAGVVMYGLRDLIGEDSINKALREFRDTYAYRAQGPYAGANNLYDVLRRHVPDSLQYYLDDTWKKLTFYDNKIVGVSAVKTGHANEYAVTIRVNIDKSYRDDNGNDVPAVGMKDYIGIGVLGADAKDADGRTVKRFLHRKKYWLTRGEHTITVTVVGEPSAAAVDPLGILIDRNQGDNYKRIE